VTLHLASRRRPRTRPAIPAIDSSFLAIRVSSARTSLLFLLEKGPGPTKKGASGPGKGPLGPSTFERKGASGPGFAQESADAPGHTHHRVLVLVLRNQGEQRALALSRGLWAQRKGASGERGLWEKGPLGRPGFAQEAADAPGHTRHRVLVLVLRNQGEQRAHLAPRLARLPARLESLTLFSSYTSHISPSILVYKD